MPGMRPTEIHNINNRMVRLEDAKDSFLEKLQASEKNDLFTNDLEVSNGVLKTELFGYEISARQRAVLDQEDNFLFEYHFTAKYDDKEIPVWIVYLTPGGVLKIIPAEEGTSLCDFNNLYIKDIILENLHAGILKTELFTPTVSTDGAFAGADLR